jgi:hypothetical protein
VTREEWHRVRKEPNNFGNLLAQIEVLTFVCEVKNFICESSCG